MSTIKDIAARVGVTDMTVSRVLNGGYLPKRAAAIARSREIHRVAEELGYRPNASARATRHGRHHAVALVVGTPDRHVQYHDEMLDGIQDACEPRGQHLILSRMTERQLTDENALPRVLSELAADGLLIQWFYDTPNELQELVERYRLPVVWVGRKQEHDCVFSEETRSGQLATQRLIDAGHRAIAFVDYCDGPICPNQHHFRADRRAGYAAAMIDAGLEPQFMSINQVDAVSLKPFTGVVTILAEHAKDITWMAMANGRSVPNSLSIASIGLRREQIGPLTLTMSCMRPRQTGIRAIELLEQKIKKPGQPLTSVRLDCDFIEGDTVSPPF